jgi:hypothetical protein
MRLCFISLLTRTCPLTAQADDPPQLVDLILLGTVYLSQSLDLHLSLLDCIEHRPKYRVGVQLQISARALRRCLGNTFCTS